jgi:hypothetical protein
MHREILTLCNHAFDWQLHPHEVEVRAAGCVARIGAAAPARAPPPRTRPWDARARLDRLDARRRPSSNWNHSGLASQLPAAAPLPPAKPRSP